VTQDDPLDRFRLQTFAIAAELGNVPAACLPHVWHMRRCTPPAAGRKALLAAFDTAGRLGELDLVQEGLVTVIAPARSRWPATGGRRARR
jgi:hypothetical protein